MRNIGKKIAGGAVALAAAGTLVAGGAVAQADTGGTANTTGAHVAGWEYAGKFATESQCGAAGRTGLARGDWFSWGCSYSPQGDPALPWFLGVMR